MHNLRAHIKQKSRPIGGFFWNRSELALGELLAATCLVEADFLTLNFTSIAGNKTSLGQCGLQRCIVFDQGAGNTVANSTCLAGLSATDQR
jgi:hypothetical protein